MANQQAKAIESLKRELEHLMGWTDQLSHADFLLLAEFVYGKTGVRLSYNTLKRIWGKVKAESQPTLTTLDALAKAAGYTSWHGYLLKNLDNEKVILPESGDFVNKKRRLPYGLWLSLAGGLGLMLLLIYVSLLPTEFDQDKVAFSVVSTSGNYPFTALFHYDISAYPNDSFFLAPQYQSKVFLDPRQKTKSVIFLMPGNYHVALLRNQDTLKTTQISVNTPDWVGFYAGQSPQSVDFQLHEMPPGKLQISHDLLESRRLPAGETYWTQFFNIRNFEAVTDELEVSVRVRNNKQQGGLTCQIVQVGLWAEHGFAECAFGQYGCSSWLKARVSEKSWEGSTSDLSAFTLDLQQWQDIQYKLKGNTFTVLANGKALFKTDYKMPLGNLKGFRINCKGSGEIDSVFARSGSGKVLMNTGFSQ
jgi:hypothetical protein